MAQIFPKSGVYYHTDADDRRWRIHVRWEELNRAGLLAERLRLQEILDEPMESDDQLRDRGRQHVETQREGLHARLLKITEELG